MKTKLLLLLAAVAAMGLYACHDIAGGGWLWSANGMMEDKATFGMNLKCYEESGGLFYDRAGGQITYHDHGVKLGDFNDMLFTGKDAKKKLQFKAVIEEPAGIKFDVCVDEIFFGSYTGTYTPIPPTLGDGGMIYVYAEDRGETGPDKDDFLKVELYGGVFDGYYNEGTPQGGNIVLK